MKEKQNISFQNITSAFYRIFIEWNDKGLDEIENANKALTRKISENKMEQNAIVTEMK